MLRALDRNAGSQPVRNLFTNPGFEASSGTVTVRTNLCTKPRMTDTSLGGYQTQTLTPVTGLTGNPDGITTGMRVSYVSGNVNPGAVVMVGPLTSTQYSLSAWVYVESADAPTIAFALKGVVAGGSPQTFTQNTWTKVTWNNYTTPASLVTGNDFAIRLTGTAAATGSFIMTGIVIEQGVPAVGSFFDGATAAAGDFTYAWAGTANASASYQRGVGVSALTNNYFCAPVSSTDWFASGTRSIRLVPNGNLTESFFSVGGSFGSLGPFVPGRTYTVLATLRLPVALTGTLYPRALSIDWRENTARQNSVQGTNVAGIQKLRFKFTVGLGATNGFVEFFNGAGPGGGDVWWDDILIVEGDYQGDYVDGSKPLSKWDGTASASTSVGYPQQLLDAAGAPLLDYSAPALYALDNSFGALEGRTFYTVYDVLGENTGGVSSIIQYGDNALNDVVPNTYVQLRQDNNSTADGMNAVFLRRTGALGVQTMVKAAGYRHVSSWGLNDSGQLFLSTDGGPLLTDSGAMASLQHQKLLIGSDQPLNRHVRTIMYRGYHSAATRQAVSRYLGNKYGAYVA